MIDLWLMSLPTWLVALIAFGWPIAAVLLGMLVGRVLRLNDERVAARDEQRMVELIDRQPRPFAERAMESDGLGRWWD